MSGVKTFLLRFERFPENKMNINSFRKESELLGFVSGELFFEFYSNFAFLFDFYILKIYKWYELMKIGKSHDMRSM